MVANPNLDNFVKWVTEGVKSPLYTTKLLETIYYSIRTYNTPEQWIQFSDEISTFKDFETFLRLAKEKIVSVCREAGLRR
jgi:hypothetical protein